MESNVIVSVKDGMVMLTDGQTAWGFEPDRAKQLAHVLYALAPYARSPREEARTVSVPSFTSRYVPTLTASPASDG